MARAMIKERRAGRPWPPQPYREWVPPNIDANFQVAREFYGLDVDMMPDEETGDGATAAAAAAAAAGDAAAGGGGVGGERAGVGAAAVGGSDGGGGGDGNSGGGGHFVHYPAAEVPPSRVPRPAVEGVSLLLPDADDTRALHHQRQIRVTTERILPDGTLWDKPPYV